MRNDRCIVIFCWPLRKSNNYELGIRRQADYPKDQTVVALFDQGEEQTPDIIAVVFKGEQLKYLQLNIKNNQLAHYLLTHPVLKDTHNPLIVIAVERSLEMVIGLLGILKAGGA
ncbi:non-ribosomal peptide synthetase [Beggiatoa sp. SS]|nr:non-ribosomal peptide synthetase [Beggiatoa sp. SS]